MTAQKFAFEYLLKCNIRYKIASSKKIIIDHHLDLPTTLSLLDISDKKGIDIVITKPML